MIIERLRKHYCGNLTFREQRNAVENFRQGPSEEVADFLVRVGSALSDLAKDWKGAMIEAELKTLQYKVSLTGVREDTQIVLNTEIAKYGRLMPEQMYNAVRTHKAYRSCNKWVEGLSPHTGQQQQQHSHAQYPSQGSSYKPHCQKTTAFAANLEAPEYSSEESQAEPQEEGTPLEAEPASEEAGIIYLPDFLTELTDAH